MGYDLTIESRSVELRNKMIEFMFTNYENWWEAAWPPEARGKKKIVISYSSGLYGEERLRVYSVVRWMALQVGAVCSKFNKNSVNPNNFEFPVPFIIYDSYEKWPVLVCRSEREARQKWPKSLWWCIVDPLGVYLSEKTSESIVSAVIETVILDDFRRAILDGEMEKLGKIPLPGSLDKTKWLSKRRVVLAKFYKPETRALLKKIRTEIRRLDKLWLSS